MKNVDHICTMIAIDLARALNLIREAASLPSWLAFASEAIGSADHQLAFDMPWHTVEGSMAGLRAKALLDATREAVWSRAEIGEPVTDALISQLLGRTRIRSIAELASMNQHHRFWRHLWSNAA